MNERLLELALQAGARECDTGALITDDIALTQFAELVRQDLYQVIGKNVIEQINGATQMERKACAQICLVMASKTEDIRRAALEVAAENILARGGQ
jgi:hypothetical protein